MEYEYNEIWDYVTNVEESDPQIPAHTLEMKRTHASLLLELPWVQPAPSADENAVLGYTAGWAEDDVFEYDGKVFDPADKSFAPGISPQEILSYLITDPGTLSGEKEKVILASGNHPHEHMGDWVLEGLVNFLTGSDPRAVEIRQSYVFYVFPCLNPDGKVLHTFDITPRSEHPYGRYAGNPELYKAGEPNHNRLWDTSGYSSIDILSAAIKADTGGKADYSWDFHGGCPHDPGDWRSIARGMSSCYARALSVRGFPSCKPKTKSVTSGGGFRRWVADELGVSYSFTHEPCMHYDRELAAEAGKNIGLAFYDIKQCPGYKYGGMNSCI